jgi:hypothetical protein
MSLGLLCAASAQAGSFFFDFNTDPASSGLFTTEGASEWVPYHGTGYETNSEDGFLSITKARSESGRIIFSDFDSGSVVQAFTFECDLRIGNGSQSPADGFSVNYCRENDPVLTGGAFATGPNCEANLPEEGTQTGIGIGFDAWPSGGSSPYCGEADQSIGPDTRAISVRVDGQLVLQYPANVQNGTCTDANSVQTGAYDGSGSYESLCWAHLKVSMAADGKLNVWWKGTRILTDYQTTYFPSPGRLVFAGRCGDLWQNQHVDNIKIETVPASLALIGQATGLADGFTIAVNDSGNSVVDTTKPVTAVLDGQNITPTAVTKNGSVTTITYRGYPTLYPVGSSHSLVLTVKDTNGNAISETRPFTTQSYGVIPATAAVTGVDTSKLGFKLLPWQSGNEPNRVYWANEQLAGFQGENNADLSTAGTDGYINYDGLINWNGTAPDNAGNFNGGNGYTDNTFPGIPGANGMTGSAALEALCFLHFQAAGVYNMGVNSDDGFAVTVGGNPKDLQAQLLGQFDGGRGASDTIFTFVVNSPGYYPFRMIWFNGNGELPGNGFNCEWFTVLPNGTKVLINDPAASNTTGIKAYYAGPALPAYLAYLNTRNGATGVRADQSLFAQLLNAGTTVNRGSIKLYLNGSVTSPVIGGTGKTNTVTLDRAFPNLLPAGNNQAALVWSDSAGTQYSNVWSFTVSPYATLDTAMMAPLGSEDASKPGFVLRVAQVDPDLVEPGAGDGMANQVDYANALIAGLAAPWYSTNTADTSTAVSGNTWYWTGEMDFAVNGSTGEFPIDSQMPGIPGVTGRDANFAAEFQSYIAFPAAGFYRMGVSSDDGFRVSESTGIARQVLHVTGPGVDRDVAAVVSTTTDGNGGFGAPLPVVPITAPVVYLDGSSCPVLSAPNMAGKIAAVIGTVCNNTLSDALMAYECQTNGAVAVILINDPTWGLPYRVSGSAPGPITIPVIQVNGFGGEVDLWRTNANLTASIGASQQIQLGCADYGKGMGWVDFGFVVPQAGLYPLHLVYQQGGGGAGLEWSRILDDGTRVLVNDPNATGSLMAYRAVKVQPRPTLSISRQAGTIRISYTGTLQGSPTVNGTYSDVAGASSPYTVPAGAASQMFYRARN